MPYFGRNLEGINATVQSSETAASFLPGLASASSQTKKRQRKYPKQQTSIKQNPICANEEEYRPSIRSAKKKTVHLKENRNVLPIKIRDIISFLTRKNRSSTVVEQVLASQGNPSYSEKQYYAYLKQKTDKIGYHVKGDTIRQLILGTVESTVMDQDEQKFYNKVIRILLCKYLNGQSILVALNSNRIKSCQKIEHLRANRQIRELIREIALTISSSGIPY